jgi:hypothetical protein
LDFYRPKNEKEKQHSELFRKILIYGGLVLAVFILASFVYAVRYSKFFKIKNINIVGIQSVSSEEFVDNLKNFFTEQSKISRFLGTDNILAWGDAGADFFKKYPQFESIRIEKKYFNKEIMIVANEREKFGIWCFKTRKDAELEQSRNEAEGINEWCGWFDRNGIIFSEAPVIETEILNRVNDLSDRVIGMGDKVLPDNFMVNLLEIFSVLEKEDINTKTIYLKDFGLEEVETASVNATPKIYFSLKFDPKFSLGVIDSLRKSGEWKKLNYVDFRVENRVYYR